FYFVHVLTPDLYIGAIPPIFTVINAVLLRPLSYHDHERLITFHTTESVLDLNDIRAWNQSFAEIGGNTIQPLDYIGGGEPSQWLAGVVTGDFFRTLGARPLFGRGITAEDHKKGGPLVVWVVPNLLLA